MRWTSGLFVSIDRAICFMIVVLPALGGDTMRPRWPLPMGAMRSMIRAVMLYGSSARSRCSRSSGNSGVRSSKRRRAAGLLGVDAVDRVDAQQRRVLLVAAGGTAGAGDEVARAQRRTGGPA